MLKRARIKEYKSLTDVEVSFQPFTVIFGPNASGKSNLMDALGLLGRMVTEKTLAKAFEKHRGEPVEAFHYGVDGIEGILDKDSVLFSMEVDVQLSKNVIDYVEDVIKKKREGIPSKVTGKPALQKRKIKEEYLRYALEVEFKPASGYLRVQNESLRALNRNWEPKKSRRPYIEKAGNKINLRLEGQAHPTYYDIGLDHTIVSTPIYEPHHPHIAAFKEELSRWGFYYLNPETLRAKSDLKEVLSLGLHGEDLAALFNTLKNKIGLKRINKAFGILLPGQVSLDVERTPEGKLMLHCIENEISYSSRIISEGTLRLIGLLGLLESPVSPTLVGFEEPENGVHPRRLRVLKELLQNASEKGIQVIVNTHSPLFAEYVAPENRLICSRKGQITTFKKFPEGYPLFDEVEIEKALDDEDAGNTFIDGILRGDFGG